MKIRTGFVSNSSSASFIVTTKIKYKDIHTAFSISSWEEDRVLEKIEEWVENKNIKNTWDKKVYAQQKKKQLQFAKKLKALKKEEKRIKRVFCNKKDYMDALLNSTEKQKKEHFKSIGKIWKETHKTLLDYKLFERRIDLDRNDKDNATLTYWTSLYNGPQEFHEDFKDMLLDLTMCDAIEDIEVVWDDPENNPKHPNGWKRSENLKKLGSL